MKSALLAEASKLAVEARIELIEALWESVAREVATLPIPSWHREELDRRLDLHERHPEATQTWSQVVADLERLDP